MNSCLRNQRSSQKWVEKQMMSRPVNRTSRRDDQVPAELSGGELPVEADDGRRDPAAESLRDPTRLERDRAPIERDDQGRLGGADAANRRAMPKSQRLAQAEPLR